MVTKTKTSTETGRAGAGTKPLTGLAFQGGSFLGGAVHTGVMQALVAEKVFETHDIRVFSGTSAGALVAASCWSHAMLGVIEGTSPQAAMASVPTVLEGMWLHNAKGWMDLLLNPTEVAMLVPTQEYADFVKAVDHTARYNPFYDRFMQSIWASNLRRVFRSWIHQYIPRSDLTRCVKRLYATYAPIKARIEAEGASEPETLAARVASAFFEDRSVPRFVFGSANVLEGKIVGFRESDVALAVDAARQTALAGGSAEPQALETAVDAGVDRLYEYIEASGSLEEINDKTTIADGPHAGTYLDGAWGQNPPINDLIDYRVREIWVVEIFPEVRQALPKSFAERRDRQEELWQNSLVEHELHMIEKVNEWIDKKYFKTDQFQTIVTRRIPMTLEFTPGARIVNWAPFLRDKIEYGRTTAKAFVARELRGGG